MATDLDRYIREHNPYSSIASVGGQKVAVAKSLGDLLNASNWATSKRSESYRPSAVFNPASSSLANSAWSGMAGLAESYDPGTPENPYSTLRNTKSPQIQSILDRVIGNVGEATEYDINQNPYMVRSNVRDSNQAGRVESAGGRVQQNISNQDQSLADFTKSYLSSQTKARGFTDQEADSISGVYDGSLASELEAQARARARAVGGATDRSLDRVRGSLNSSRLLGGQSSYADALANRQAMDAAIAEQIAQSDLARQNTLTVQDYQNSLLGRRASAEEGVSRMGLLPIQARADLTGQQLNQLGQVGDLINQNTIYNVDTPESIMSRKLGILGQAGNLDQANNFYGLQAPYQPDFSGYAYGGPAPSPGGYGGGYSSPGFANPYMSQRQPAPSAPPTRAEQPAYNLPSYLYRNSAPTTYAMPGGPPPPPSGTGFTGGGAMGGTYSDGGFGYSTAPYYDPRTGEIDWEALYGGSYYNN